MIAAAALLIVATAVAYSPSLHGSFILDDHMLLVDSPLVKAPDGLYRFWLTTTAVDYWPAFNSALWLQWRLWGLDPTGYRVVNVALHIVDALLLWAVLWRLAIPGAFVAALLFALHPVNVETVAWITQLKNLLALTFSLVAVLFYLGSEAHATRPGNGRAARWRYCASLLAFALAMLSKSSAVILPVVLLGIAAAVRGVARRDVVRMLPFVPVGAACTLATAWFRARFDTDPRSLTVLELALQSSAALWFYLSKALLPVQLAFIYPKWDVRAGELRWWVPLLATLALTALLWRARHGWARPVLWAWLFYAVALAPALAMSGAGYMEKWTVADHYQHIALIAVVALAGACWSWWRERWPPSWLPDAALVAVLGAFGVLTWQQSALYRDAVPLFRASLANSPSSAFAQYNLGAVLLSRGQPAEAQPYLQNALRLNPQYLEAHHDLALALIRLRRFPEAIEHLRVALELEPDYAEAENTWGSALLEAGEPERALAHYRRAIAIRPNSPEAHYNLGIALYRLGRHRDAIDHFRTAAHAKTDYADAHNALGAALVQVGEREQAAGSFREALRIDPSHHDARSNLDEVLADAPPISR